jgi:AraC-like DNA-binding protein
MLQRSDEWMPRCQDWILIRVAEGAGYWLKATAGGELNVGDGLVLGYDSKTILRSSLLCHMKLQFFTVQPQYLIGLITIKEQHRFEILSKKSASHFLLLRANEPMGQKYIRLTEQARGNGLSARCALLQFWASAVAAIITPLKDSSAGGNTLRDRFQRLLAQMSEPEFTACSLQELARQLQCSKRHFCRLFREQFGVPLRMHRTELRLLRALPLLMESNAKINDVAGLCGYRNSSFFIGMFKKRFGMTPGAWCRQAQENLSKTQVH